MNIRRLLRFIVPVLPFISASPAQSAEVQTQVGLAISEPVLAESTFQGESVATVTLDVRKALGVSTRTTVYWTPSEGRSTN